MKSPGAKLNTHEVTILGMAGLGDNFGPTMLTVRFTSDKLGEIISISDARMQLITIVDYERVEALIEETRRERTRR